MTRNDSQKSDHIGNEFLTINKKRIATYPQKQK